MVALLRHTSLVEALVSSDVRHAYTIARCFMADGEKADTSWRPDPRLLLDLPPGLCERLLAFPFRERAGAVEVATLSPFERTVSEEFTFHLRRPVALFRGNLQALLAAAGTPVDLGVLTHSLSEPPPRVDASPIPLVRKSNRKAEPRPRTRTSPGIGDDGSASLYPPSPFDQVDTAASKLELVQVLGRLLAQPYLIFDVGDDHLRPLVSSPRVAPGPSIERWQENLFCTAADQGRYLGPYGGGEIQRHFLQHFAAGDLISAERIGDIHHGILVVQKVRFDGSDEGELLERARQAWLRIDERGVPLH
jgi:hypothetical protein